MLSKTSLNLQRHMHIQKISTKTAKSIVRELVWVERARPN